MSGWTRQTMPRAQSILLGLLLSIVVSIKPGVAFQNPEPGPAPQSSPAQTFSDRTPVPQSYSAKPATQLAARQIILKVGGGELVQFPDSASQVSVSEPSIADA